MSLPGDLFSRRAHLPAIWRLVAGRPARVTAALLLMTTALVSGAPLSAFAQSGGEVIVADVDGAIDPVMARFISRVLDKADKERSMLVVLRINTPGGFLKSTRDIVTDILALSRITSYSICL